MRIGIIADWLNPNMERLVQLLTDRGVTMTLIYPEKQLTDVGSVRVEHDLYLLKSGTEPALSLGGALHVSGAMTLNPYPTVAMMRNKVIVTRALQAAGVPTPETYMTCTPSEFAPLLDAGPLMLKPYQGTRGAGVRVLRHAEELDALPSGELLLAQRYHAPDGPDHKLFRIGERVFGIRRIWPIRTYEDKLGEPFDPSPELREIAFKCGEAFGINLYGLDVVMSQGQPYVVDLNKFGSYMGVPDGPRLLADHIYAAGQRAMRGDALVPTAKATSTTAS
ncbi:MAG: lysine biosynthesis protein LysX [Ktedonobacterales bacterium]